MDVCNAAVLSGGAASGNDEEDHLGSESDVPLRYAVSDAGIVTEAAGAGYGAVWVSGCSGIFNSRDMGFRKKSG